MLLFSIHLTTQMKLRDHMNYPILYLDPATTKLMKVTVVGACDSRNTNKTKAEPEKALSCRKEEDS